jgi:hypothetical protein
VAFATHKCLIKDQVVQINPNLSFCSAVFISICSKKHGMVHRPDTLCIFMRSNRSITR